MTTHYDEQLSSLLNGELSGAETREVVTHLRECGPCTSVLISVAVSHGALRAARRAMGPSTTPLRVPPAPTEALAPLVLPSPRRGRWVATLAAAVLLLVGTMGALKLASLPSGAPAVAVASLHHLDSPATALGHVTVHRDTKELKMSVSTSGLPVAPANHFYEVWLLAPRTNKMLPLGVLSEIGTSTYSISASIMSQFSAVDISLQNNDGSPQHSATSVLRGTVTAV
ncbi:MAG: anti-sigma factor [Actinomycetota bacterium]|nr:anti-sigma factor [Actinomycetota bacterium]